MVAAAVVGSAVVGGVVSSSSAGKASSAQQKAADKAAATQQGMFDTTQKNLAPYMATGSAANNQLAYLMGLPGYGNTQTKDQIYQSLLPQYTSSGAGGAMNALQTAQNGGTVGASSMFKSNNDEQDFLNWLSSNNISTGGGGSSVDYNGLNSAVDAAFAAQGQEGSGYGSLAKPVVMDQAHLEQTPGYQFNLTQGLKATQNAASARGLGSSGAALKGAASYATGLADNTYQQQFANEITNQTNQYNRLAGIANSGQSAAAGLGATSAQVGSNIANSQIGAGNAAAAGAIGTGNAISGGISNAANSYYMNQLMQGMYGSGGGNSYGDAEFAGYAF